MQKLVGQHKDRETAYQSPSQAKQTRLGEKELFNVLPIKIDFGSEKQKMKFQTTPSPHSPLARVNFTPSFLTVLSLPIP